LISIKGGVGKTTLSASLAETLANKYGKKVLLVDANYSAPNLGLHMDVVAPNATIHDVLSEKNYTLKGAIHKQYGVDVVPGSFLYSREINPLKLKDKIAGAKKGYDFIVLDSSPSLNDEILSTMIASDHLFVVSTPDYPTLSCSMKAAKLAKQRNKPIDGIIINKVSDPAYEITLEEIQESTGIPVIGRVRQDKSVNRALFFRKPATLYSKRSRFSREVNRIASTLAGEKEKNSSFGKFLGSPKRERVNREVMREDFYKSAFRK